MNKKLATKIFETLNKKGAGLGDASVLLIEKVLDRELPKIILARSDNGYTGQESEAMKNYEFGLHQHWKDDKGNDLDDDGHGGSIKHFQD